MLQMVFLPILILSVGWVSAQRVSGGGEAFPGILTNQISLEDWRSRRFGMFIHWGPVSLRGTEIGWSRGNEIPAGEYDQLYREFDPQLFNAVEWVDAARSAGMRYMIVVSKHHDGFTLWDSEATAYDIMATPLQRDILSELAVECRRQGVLFGTYYSILDWFHPDYPVRFTGGPLQPDADMNSYIRFMRRQLEELIRGYQTRILWFDGEWEKPWTHSMGMELYAWLRSLDNTLLINNRVDKGRRGMEGTSQSPRFAGDFETPEQRIGTFDTSTPWESCITLGTQWSWKPNDQLKSPEECIRTLVQTVGGDGNLLLNVGPMPDGRIEPAQLQILADIGNWLEVYGDTIFGTRGGPAPPQPWGVLTQKEDQIFVHILDGSRSRVRVPLQEPVRSAKTFAEGLPVAFTKYPEGVVLDLDPVTGSSPDLVIVLEKAEPPR